MSIEAEDLQQKIRSSIPLSEAMQFSIIELSPHAIRVQAPLEPNVNIHGTGFAGSIYSLAILTGWALSTHIMALNNIQGDLVVVGAEIKYRSPLSTAISCRCQASEKDCQAFESGFKSNGKGKLELEIQVGDSKNAVLRASYAALSSSY